MYIRVESVTCSFLKSVKNGTSGSLPWFLSSQPSIAINARVFINLMYNKDQLRAITPFSFFVDRFSPLARRVSPFLLYYNLSLDPFVRQLRILLSVGKKRAYNRRSPYNTITTIWISYLPATRRQSSRLRPNSPRVYYILFLLLAR